MSFNLGGISLAKICGGNSSAPNLGQISWVTNLWQKPMGTYLRSGICGGNRWISVLGEKSLVKIFGANLWWKSLIETSGGNLWDKTFGGKSVEKLFGEESLEKKLRLKSSIKIFD